MRAALYMGALVATRYNPVIKEFYERLIAKGKAKKVAITACMRKLLSILNAMIKHRTRWGEWGEAPGQGQGSKPHKPQLWPVAP